MEISVIISNYNTEKYLLRSIRSVLNQSFNKQEMEIFVIDDASIDNSMDILRRHVDKDDIRLVYNDKNIGLSASCNKAVMLVKGKFTYFVDSDDFINKDALLVSHSFISNNKDSMDAVSCDYYEVSEKEAILKRRDGMAFPIRCGILYYTDHLIELGPYNTDVEREDIDFRKRYLKSGKYIYNIPVPYYRYTQHDDSLTKNCGEKTYIS